MYDNFIYLYMILAVLRNGSHRAVCESILLECVDARAMHDSPLPLRMQG